jgi:ABC-2 type transport system permease protein
MSGSVFRRTLRDLCPAIAGWGALLALTSMGNVAAYPAIQDLPELIALIEKLPRVIQAMIGDPEALTGPEGFLRLKLFSSWLLYLLALFAILQASPLIAGERERGTLDLLLAQPIARRRVVLEKFAALALALLVICALVAAGLVAAARLCDVEVDRGWLVLSTFNTAPLALVFGAATLLASCNLRRARPALITGAALLAGSIFVQTLAPLSAALRSLRSLTPLRAHDLSQPLNGDLAPGYVVLQLALAAVLLAAAAWTFERRDLTS